MKKRILTMLLAGVLSVTLLAGCGGSKEPAANTEETTEQTSESTQAVSYTHLTLPTIA